MTRIGAENDHRQRIDTGSTSSPLNELKPKKRDHRKPWKKRQNTNTPKLKNQPNISTEVQSLADSLAGAYYGFILLGAAGQQLEEKTARAVYILMDEIETIEQLDEIIGAVKDQSAKEALTRAADKLLGRNQPSWHEDQGLVQGLLISLAIVGLMAAFVFN